MAKLSAGLLMYRYRNHRLEVLIVHPGGPYWAGKMMEFGQFLKVNTMKEMIPLKLRNASFLKKLALLPMEFFSRFPY